MRRWAAPCGSAGENGSWSGFTGLQHLREQRRYLPLRTVQRFASKPGVVTAVYVTVAPGDDPLRVAAAIEHDEPTLATIAGVGDYGKVDRGCQ